MEYNSSNQPVMKELCFGEANRSPGESFQSGAQGQMFPLQALHGRLAHLVLRGGQTGRIRAPGISEPLRHDPARFREQGQQAPKGGVGAPAKNEGHDLAGARIFHPPQPALLLFAAHKRPPFIGAQAQIGRSHGLAGSRRHFF